MTTVETDPGYPANPEQMAEHDTQVVLGLLNALHQPLDTNFEARDAVVAHSFEALGFEKARYNRIIEGPRSNKPELFVDAIDAWLARRTPGNAIGAYTAAAMLEEIVSHAEGSGVAKRRSRITGIVIDRVENSLAGARESGATGSQLDFYATLRSTLEFDRAFEQAKMMGKVLGVIGVGLVTAHRFKRRR